VDGFTPCQLLAALKARAVARTRPEAIVIGADTAVWCNGRLIGKPRDRADAVSILTLLTQSPHLVISGLALVWPCCGLELVGSDATRVHMRRATPKEIEDYVASGEADGKAGAYAIQEKGDRFVESLEGSFSNVVGLPLELLAGFLETAGIDLPKPAH